MSIYFFKETLIYPKNGSDPGLRQLPFFIEFLKVSGLFDAWVADCPLSYQSNNGSDRRAVLSTFLLSILAGHHRYAHISAIRQDGIHPELLGVEKLVSEDAVRRALLRMEESSGVAWLDRHVETGNDSYRFKQSSATAKDRIKSREKEKRSSPAEEGEVF